MAKSIIREDAVIFQEYFNEMLEMYGIDVLYYQRKEKCSEWNAVGELSANYYSPIEAKILFDQIPSVKTLKKLGWVTELDSQQPIVHMKYDLPGLQQGCLIKVKDPLSLSNDGRMFRITKMSTGIIYPFSITAQIVAIVGTDIEETVNPYNGPKSIFLDKPEGVD